MSALALAVAGLAIAAGVDDPPKSVQDKLDNKHRLDPQRRLGESAYLEFVAKGPPPRTIGYASSYSGNPWRADVMSRLQNTTTPK